MKSIARLRHLRVSARKVRMVTDLIRGKSFQDASHILRFVVKRGAHPVLKLLNSALANAKQKFNAEAQNLRIAKITVDDGPKLKRYRPRARGQTYPIHKKTSHITIVLEEIQPREETPGVQTPGVTPAGVTPGVTAQQTPGVRPERKEAPVQKPLREEKRWSQGIRKLPKIFRRKAI
ncbi:MAG: 50S ribosomal protein L22 [Candidatus Wildermuthbacteria bacterium]|nr:50S ribosomal protein L22 [Candidatus Wildermuthbacteria bacterium]